MATSQSNGIERTAINPYTGRVAEMKPTPRNPRLGIFADAMMAVRDFVNRAQIPQNIPLIGGEGLGSLVLGRAPEELVEMSYGNMPVRVNPYAGTTASFVPEIKPGRQVQVADLLSLAGVPGGGRTAAATMMGAMPDAGAVERAVFASLNPQSTQMSLGAQISDELSKKYPGIKLDVSGNNDLTISRIIVPKEQRGSGIGTQVMEDILRIADETGKRISLSPSTDFGASSKSRLTDFYKRFGFVENKGKNKDFSISESMYRMPQNQMTQTVAY